MSTCVRCGEESYPEKHIEKGGGGRIVALWVCRKCQSPWVGDTPDTQPVPTPAAPLKVEAEAPNAPAHQAQPVAAPVPAAPPVVSLDPVAAIKQRLAWLETELQRLADLKTEQRRLQRMLAAGEPVGRARTKRAPTEE